MTHHDDPFAHAEHTAHVWLRRITDDLATRDRAFAYRVTRAWLHTVRDRLDVTGAAHLSAQLPVVLRGIYFEGWVPEKVPVAHQVSSFVADFAVAAGVTEDEAVGLAWLVTDALRDLFSPGELETVFHRLPNQLRDLLFGVSVGPSDEEEFGAV
ncbi:DUF2267 domain-containing protein [Nocardia sp. CS682]|uniref:DUF2267 domain-containing protein n=1 Tax=Nocardia sp. CS682 TaxID=1047172 RepID=UPI001074D37F|nr:DUF2267 domain-containing protein [Nocardia sp. CS682]QBS45323.1 DUF2267 domain-containing protein [Nocardia sp. CS682]